MAANKLEEQCEKGYSYWAANAAGEAPPPQPKLLSEEEARQQAEQLTHVSSGASAWNAAGTLEERTIALDWIKAQLEQLLLGLDHHHQGAAVAVQRVTGCEGEAHQWIVRGKKRAGFELSGVEFTWRVQLGGGTADVCGKARVPHAAADELDELQLEVTPDAAPTAAGADAAAGAAPASEAQKQAAVEAARSMLPLLEGVFEQLLERARQK
ncbi:hypothetical protein D9Q98_007961 [Chlorella vulgaris]|uniref:Activator of Hsp90 ATPase AHSA1-like N-terminal domain-containing protein n=1 Tax=Chlorella vulgaris TaxID=3077 RepID=A0A9D4THX4_CHLVU|nr:hypothetical protein D9Q98_007961 [Chlorella vulgaris]